MKHLCFISLLLFCCSAGFCQKSLISYDDIKYLLRNNLDQADAFLTAKGYSTTKKDIDHKNRKYFIALQGGTQTNISVRADGKRLFIEIETNEFDQYSLIKESIAQFINKDAMVADVQSYTIKELGDIYITINDTVPYDPLKKDYDIQIVPDKHVMAYN